MSKSFRILTGLAVVAVGVALALGWRATSGLSGIAGAQESRSTQLGISVQGQGRVTGAPDVMRLDIGVDVHQATVQAALDGAKLAATKVIQALRGHGVEAKDIQTTQLSISAEYEYPKNAPPHVKGYFVSNRVRALIRDLDKAGGTIDAATTAGGTDVRIGGISFDLEDNTALLKAARDAAFADAKAKATQYAAAAHRPLGAVRSITESVSPAPMAMNYAMTSGGTQLAPMPAPMPIQPGQQELVVTVSVLYSFA